jgi:cell division protein FtsB
LDFFDTETMGLATPIFVIELAAERVELLEKENAELQQEAEELADEIRELSGETASRI